MCSRLSRSLFPSSICLWGDTSQKSNSFTKVGGEMERDFNEMKVSWKQLTLRAILISFFVSETFSFKYQFKTAIKESLIKVLWISVKQHYFCTNKLEHRQTNKLNDKVSLKSQSNLSFMSSCFILMSCDVEFFMNFMSC